MQTGIHWWGPEYSIEFDLTVKQEEGVLRPANVFHVTEMKSGYPTEKSELPGVWIAPDKRIAIETSYTEGYVYFNYKVGQKYQIMIMQKARTYIQETGPECWSWPFQYTFFVYVNNKKIAERIVEGKDVAEQMFRSDYDCNNRPKLAPPCPRIPWKEVAIYASNPWHDPIQGQRDIAKFENFKVYSQKELELPPDEIRCTCKFCFPGNGL